ncbi:MAG TPA: HEAT repeat domain-containing protein, partial [Stellaceae bacterium]|nr:HEAT repeat domain-containing protein [Stellaceae bacterium]
NSASPRLIPAVAANLADPSPLVRAMAIWALARLASADAFRAEAAARAGDETDPAVAQEWQAALSESGADEADSENSNPSIGCPRESADRG